VGHCLPATHLPWCFAHIAWQVRGHEGDFQPLIVVNKPVCISCTLACSLLKNDQTRQSCAWAYFAVAGARTFMYRMSSIAARLLWHQHSAHFQPRSFCHAGGWLSCVVVLLQSDIIAICNHWHFSWPQPDSLTLSVKMQFFQCIVMSVLLYSGETWAVMKQHISPLAVFQMICLRRICGISLRNHVPNVVILNKCNTLSVESQLQGKRLRWLGHVFRMPNDRLPKKLLFGEVKVLRPPGRPRSSFNDVALHDCQNCRISRPYRDAQDRLLWRDKTCPART